tara:strand:- start:68 stop:337 length:270 start_codon:yes stop_codon:yes gene_type:complete
MSERRDWDVTVGSGSRPVRVPMQPTPEDAVWCAVCDLYGSPGPGARYEVRDKGAGDFAVTDHSRGAIIYAHAAVAEQPWWVRLIARAIT